MAFFAIISSQLLQRYDVHFIYALLKKYVDCFVPAPYCFTAIMSLFSGINSFVIISSLCVLILFVYVKKKIGIFSFKILTVLFLLIELLSFGNEYLQMAEIKKISWDKDVVGFLKKQPQLFRVTSLTMMDGFPYNNSSIDEIQHLTGYETLRVKRFDDYLKPAIFSNINNTVNLKNVRLLDAANVKFIIVSRGIRIAGLEKVFEGMRATIFKNGSCLPRAFIVLKPKNQDAEGVFFEEDKVLGEQSENNMADIYKYSPRGIALKVKLQTDGFLILADTFYPGWKVFAQKENAGGFIEKQIIQANSLFRAVYLEKGNYKVKFVFRPFSLFLGLVFSFLSLTACLILLAFLGRTRI